MASADRDRSYGSVHAAGAATSGDVSATAGARPTADTHASAVVVSHVRAAPRGDSPDFGSSKTPCDAVGAGPVAPAKPRQSCHVRWRIALLALMCFQILVGAGVVYGWPALESTMISVGVYKGACDKHGAGGVDSPAAAGMSPGTCHAQLLKLNTIYVAASWGCQASGLLGFVLDKVGMRVTVVGSSLALALGAVLFAMSYGGGGSQGGPPGSAPAWFDAYLPGLLIMGVAGSGIYLAAQGLGTLFPRSSRRVALFAITGVFAPSMLVFLAFHMLIVQWDVATMRTAFLGYAAFQAVLTVVSAVVWPHHFDPVKEPSLEELDAAASAAEPNNDAQPRATPATVGNGTSPASSQSRLSTAQAGAAPTPSRGSLLSNNAADTGNGVTGYGWHGTDGLEAASEGGVPGNGRRPLPDSAVMVHVNSSSDERLQRPLLTPPEPEGPTFLSQLKDKRFICQVLVFSVMLLPAQFYIGNLGSQIGRVATHHSTVSAYTRYFNLVYSFASFGTPALGVVTDRLGFRGTYIIVTCLYITSFAIITWVSSLPWWFASFFVYTFARNGQFSLFVSYLAVTFGQRHLGKLIGIGFLASAMVSIVQSPLLQFVLGPLDGNFTWGNIGLMVAMGAMSPYAVMLPGPPKRRRTSSARSGGSDGGSASVSAAGSRTSDEAQRLLGDELERADQPRPGAERSRGSVVTAGGDASEDTGLLSAAA